MRISINDNRIETFEFLFGTPRIRINVPFGTLIAPLSAFTQLPLFADEKCVNKADSRPNTDNQSSIPHLHLPYFQSDTHPGECLTRQGNV